MSARLPGFIADSSLSPVIPATIGSTIGRALCVAGCAFEYGNCLDANTGVFSDNMYGICVCDQARGYCMARCYGGHYEPRQCVSNAH
jgi:hypothetical protein